MRRKRSMLSISRDKPRRITQTLARDEFGELPARKRHAGETARLLGHQLTGWHRRTNDTAGRWNAFCSDCNAPAVVCTEAPEGLPDVYGKALTDQCG